MTLCKTGIENVLHQELTERVAFPILIVHLGTAAVFSHLKDAENAAKIPIVVATRIALEKPVLNACKPMDTDALRTPNAAMD